MVQSNVNGAPPDRAASFANQAPLAVQCTRGFFMSKFSRSLVASDANDGNHDAEDRAYCDDRLCIHRQHLLSDVPPD